MKYEDTIFEVIDMLYLNLLTGDEAEQIHQRVMERIHQEEELSVYWWKLLGLSKTEVNLFMLGFDFEDLVIYRYENRLSKETLDELPEAFRKIAEDHQINDKGSTAV